jgi:UDP-N-acetylmuramoyl-tripeptide--D-alanyl-D-alanine ligase
MREWSAERVAHSAGASLLAPQSTRANLSGPTGVSIDSRVLRPGDLFVGLRGERTDGGSHAAQALASGAWGVLVASEHGGASAAAAASMGGAVLVHRDPLAGMQALAHAWRLELRSRGAKVVAITGSTGKTSTKDILAALLAARLRSAASPENLNTEIGLPLALLAAPGDVEVVVLEMAMRGSGQIAELTAIAEPDVGVIVNVGPAHLELLGSLEAIAAAKAELIAGMSSGTSVVIPAGEPLLEPHLRSDLEVISFGEQGEVSLLEVGPDGAVVIAHGEERLALLPSFAEAHNRRNLLAAVAAARALGHTPAGRLEVRFSAMRGQRVQLGDGTVLIDDCYNANPMSMRAAIEELAATAPARRVAVLGDMLELGPAAPALHREIGRYAAEVGVDLLVSVGPLAVEIARTFAGETHTVPDAAGAVDLLPRLLQPGDTVLVKASRGVGLERVSASLGAADRAPTPGPLGEPRALAPSAGPERR